MEGGTSIAETIACLDIGMCEKAYTCVLCLFVPDVRLGHQRTCAAQLGMSALPPIATAKTDFRTTSCSAAADVRFGPIADSSSAHLVRVGEVLSNVPEIDLS